MEGTPVAERLIEVDRSLVLAADVPTHEDLYQLLEDVSDAPSISAVKLGFMAGLDGLAAAADIVDDVFDARCWSIYDHQKGGTDLPDMDEKFAEKLMSAGIDAAILFPLTGPKTQRRWTSACLKVGLRVIIGGMMTHDEFLVSEGGYVADDAPSRIYNVACDQGIVDFVLPGNKLSWMQKIVDLLNARLGAGNYAVHSPGLIRQGGSLSESGKIAGSIYHPIIGGGVYDLPRTERLRAVTNAVTVIGAAV